MSSFPENPETPGGFRLKISTWIGLCGSLIRGTAKRRFPLTALRFFPHTVQHCKKKHVSYVLCKIFFSRKQQGKTKYCLDWFLQIILKLRSCIQMVEIAKVSTLPRFVYLAVTEKKTGMQHKPSLQYDFWMSHVLKYNCACFPLWKGILVLDYVLRLPKKNLWTSGKKTQDI